MSGLRRLRVTELHPNLLCILCGGYYVDATTIVECLHSFCKTCIVRYLESSKFCPICDVQVHKTKPILSIRPDKTLQDIVYKLVPGLYQNEMCRRREFYSSHPEAEPSTPEDGGRDLGRWYVLPDDPVSVALHPAPSSYSPKCVNIHSTSTPTTRCPSTKTPLEENETSQQDVKKEKGNSHVRYLQCPAGVSVAQLKRLLRAKFGVGPTHPIGLLTCTSADPLSDTLTLVDVAYITSWQRTEPLQLQYRIYERASKKIKLDPETFSSESCNPNEGMPKLEPSVGNGVDLHAYGSLDAAGNVLEYGCAPRLQAFTSDCDASFARDEDEKPARTNGSAEVGAVGGVRLPECKDCASDNPSTSRPPGVPEGRAEKDEFGRESGPLPRDLDLTQGSLSDSRNVMKTETGGGEISCDSNSLKVASVTSSSNVVDTYVTYAGAYAAPSNGVNVGVTFIPSEMGYISSAGVPCAIIPSGSCVPVSGNCIPSSPSVPSVCSSAALHRPLQGEGGATDNVNLWVTTAGLLSETALLPAEAGPAPGETRDGEEEGKEVQLTISESGVMSASGRGTTVEGMVNAIESEACELLSKIESGSLGEDFPPKTSENFARRVVQEPNAGINRSKTGESKPADAVKSKVEGMVCGGKSAPSKGERVKNVSFVNVPSVTPKPSTVGSKDSNETPPVERASVDDAMETVINNKSHSESCNEAVEKKQSESKSPSDAQIPKDLKEGNNFKDARSSHIPASLTAASMANLNKPHLKAGPSKASYAEELKHKDSKSNSEVNLKKEGKIDQGSKQTTSGSCRKSSQPFGYKTLKTPPKSWNPTISREQLALAAGKSANGKGTPEVRTNKFFKVRNAPRFLGNPSAGIKPMYSGTDDGASSQKRGVVVKIDPKTLGPITVPVSNDSGASACPTTSASSSTSSVSSDRLAVPSANRTTVSVTGSLPTTTIGLASVPSQAVVAETSVSPAVSHAEDKAVAGTKVAVALPALPTSVAKESTNSSSKVAGGKIAANTQDVKESNDISKLANTVSSTSSSTVGKSKNRTCTTGTAKDDFMKSVRSSVGNSKLEAVGRTSAVPETKTNEGNTGQLTSSFGGLVDNPNTPKLYSSIAGQTCTTQLRATTVNTLSASGAGFQTQQHFTVGAPTVGIIPSCGVSLPATIGTMPLPYYSSPSLGYPTYPYFYQSPEAMGLIPPHPSASFIPSFPTILPPRAPLSPRNTGGAKMIQDITLQPNILPMVPIVSQVPSQASSPRPMTPPSPKTPTSNQSPKPYPMQSPRQSTTTHSRPPTPQSPKPLGTGHPARSSAQSPKLQANQPVKSHLGNQPSLPVTQPTVSTLIPNMSQSQISSSKLNACVQTSLSHTMAMMKANATFVTPPIPAVPQSPKIPIVNQLSQQVAPVSSSYSNTPHSSSPSRPKTPPQSPKPPCSVSCTALPESPHTSGISSQPDIQRTSQSSKCSTSFTSSLSAKQTTSISTAAATTVSQAGASMNLVPSSGTPGTQCLLPVTQQATVPTTGGQTLLQGSTQEGSATNSGVPQPSLSQVSLSNPVSTVSPSLSEGENSGNVSSSRGKAIADISSSITSSQLTSLPVLAPVCQSSVSTLSAVLSTCSTASPAFTTSTYSSIAAVTSCTSLTQSSPSIGLPPSSNTSGASSTIPTLSCPVRPVMSAVPAEAPEVMRGTVDVPSKESLITSASLKTSMNPSISVNSPSSVGCMTTGTSHDTSSRHVTVSSAPEPSVTSPSGTSFYFSSPAITADALLAPTTSAASTAIGTSADAASKCSTAVTALNMADKVDTLTTRISNVNTSSVANTFPSSTTTSVAISPNVTGSTSVSTSVPFNGTTGGVGSPQREGCTRPPTVSTAATALSQTIDVLHPVGGSVSSEGAKPVVVLSAKEKGGNLPQPSACSPVCDVTHVIDAKLPRAERGVGGSDGPRPCLKS